MTTGWAQLLGVTRRDAVLSQDELARMAGTSRTALSAYERGRKAPTADTFERIITAAGGRLGVDRQPRWTEVKIGGPRTCWVPDVLWRLPVDQAMADVVLPVELNWSSPGRLYRCRDRRQRARLYELLLREGEPADLERWVDGALLVDSWAELTLPRAIRTAWDAAIWSLSSAESAETRASAPSDSAP